jgi:hypothetical protein
MHVIDLLGVIVNIPLVDLFNESGIIVNKALVGKRLETPIIVNKACEPTSLC